MLSSYKPPGCTGSALYSSNSLLLYSSLSLLKLLEGVGAISSTEQEVAEKTDFQANVTTLTDADADNDAVTREDGDDPSPDPPVNQGNHSQSIKSAIGKVCPGVPISYTFMNMPVASENYSHCAIQPPATCCLA